jgi:hypothetical protein
MKTLGGYLVGDKVVHATTGGVGCVIDLAFAIHKVRVRWNGKKKQPVWYRPEDIRLKPREHKND